MYRVVTKYRNGTSRPVVERGPWHTSKKTAEEWAQTLREHGYVAHVETQSGLAESTGGGGGDSSNDDLMSALASMA